MRLYAEGKVLLMGWTTRFAAIFAALTLAAVGCSSNPGTTDAATEATGDAADAAGTSSTDDSSASDGSDASGSDSTGAADDTTGTGDDGSTGDEMTVDEITELLFPSFDQQDQAALEAQWEDQERERQILIAECMAEQGFEYQPVEYPGSSVSFGPGGDLDPTTREYAEEYGFGWSTTFFEDQEYMDDEFADWVDPNQEYVDGLSESAQEAYYLALYGEEPEIDPSMSEEEIDALFEENPELFGPQGCEGEAWQDSSPFGDAEKVWREFGDQLNDLYERVQADPRIVAVQDDWAECMAGKGYAFSSMDDMYMQLDERMQELWGEDAYVDPLADFTEEEIAELTDEDFEELFAGPAVDEEVLAEIQAWEIAMAVDSFDCGGTTMFEDFEEIFGEYQDEFIEQNLDAIRAALASDS